jgi:hypothetical protein
LSLCHLRSFNLHARPATESAAELHCMVLSSTAVEW